jgi:FAD synthase
MNAKSTKRLVREGDFAAEVSVNLVEAEGGWTPYLPLEDAYKLDDVREALRVGDLERASQLADRVYRLTPVEARGDERRAR